MMGSAHQTLDVAWRKLNLMGRESEGGADSQKLAFCVGETVVFRF